MKKHILAAIMLLSVAGPAVAQERLIFPSFNPAGGPESVLLGDWAGRVNADSNGTIQVEVRDGTVIANFNNIFDRVTTGVVQIGWMLPGNIAGRFPSLDVIGLPGIRGEADVAQASAAAWRLYASGLLDRDFAGLKVLEYGAHAITAIHFRDNPNRESFSDLSGLRIAVQGGNIVDIVTRLGGTPISLQSPEWYEALQRGTVDGIVTSWAAFPVFNLGEVTSYHLEAPLGSGTHAVFMEQGRFDALPPDAQRAIEGQAGEAFSRLMGQHFENSAIRGRERAIANGSEIRQLTDAELQVWQEQAIQPVLDRWAEEQDGGAALIDAYRRIVAEVVAEN